MAEEQRNIGDQNVARIRNVTPTILIGLGGTGKEVLLRLRRRFYEKYNFFGFPTMAYLWLDTDTQNTDIDGQELDHIMESVLFRQDECVNAEIPSSAFTEYFRNQRSSPHIFSWLDQKLAGMGSVVNGAGQVRPLGRLAFFHSYQEIRNKLDEAWAQVRADAAHREMATKHRIEVDTEALNVILIFSIAGGTGSGMFLDMAFLCREALRDAKPKITGYLLLPSVFADALNANKKIFANGYAALKELEYYSWRKDVDPQGTGVIDSAAASVSRHDFVADWANAGYGHDRSPAPIMAPAFNTCFLIDNVTQGGGVIRPSDKKYLCDMIAENIFLNFSAEEFSRHKDSIRANLEQYLGKPLYYNYQKYGTQGGYMEMFSQRFSTMGFSKLYVPVDRIRRACGYQLALDLIGEWLKPNDRAEIELQQVMEARELEQLGLRARPGSGDLVSALRKSGEITFEDDIRAKVAQLRESLLQQVNNDKHPSLYTQIPKFLKDFVKHNFDRSDPTRPETWGTYIVSLEQNRQKLIARECGEFDPLGQQKAGAPAGQILARVKHWLKDDKTRLDQAVELLKIAGKVLDLHVSEIYVKGKEACERKAAAAAEDIKIKLEIARDEESGRIVQRRSLRILVDLICEQITEHLVERMRGWIVEAAINVIQKNIKPYIGTEIIRKDDQGNEMIDRAGLILELWLLREQLSAAQKEMRARFESFERVEQHLIYENLYQQDMFREYYRIEQPQGVQHPVASKLKELESLFLQQVNKDNPYDLRELINRQGPRTFLGKLDDFCHKQFQQLEVDANALEKFIKLYKDESERRRRLQRFVKNGSVWLQMSTKAANDERLRANRQAEALISRSPKTDNNDEYETVYKTIKELLPKEYRQPDIRTVRTADAVFLYTEYAGIPLAYVNGLDRYFEEAYLPLIREGTPLHIDYHEDKFTDILTKSNDDVDQILRANQVLLVGTILRTVTASSNVASDGDVNFAFRSYSDGVPRVQPLGSRRIAVETLKRNEALLNAIQNENVRRRLQMTPEARLQFCAILAYHTSPGGPFEAVHRPGGGGMETYFPPEGKALDQARGEEYEQVLVALGKDETVENRAREAIARLLGAKDDFSQELMIDKYRIRILKDANAAASNINT
jgi:Tubulin like